MDEMKITENSTVQRAEQVASRSIAGKMVLMKAPIPTLNTLNGVAGFIWEQLETPKSIGELASCLAGEYEVSAEEAETDLLLFVKDMVRRDLIEIKG
tara:strand:- start:7233 stop:7523 length:291 start_codon:yes stop_codon:yes gene_type:complete